MTGSGLPPLPPPPQPGWAPAPADGGQQAPPLVAQSPPAHPPADSFFTAPPPPRSERSNAFLDLPGRPVRFALALMGIGLFTIFFSGAGFLHQLVLIAPVFEEMLKFGLALLIVAGLGIRNPILRLLVAVLPGAAFGVAEHYLTYSFEEPFFFGERVAFHTTATLLSMATYTAIEPATPPGLRWGATAPATAVHMANNTAALALGILGLFLPIAEDLAYGFVVFPFSAILLSFVVSVRPDLARALARRAWGALVAPRLA